MDYKIHFLFYYLLFLFTWTVGAFLISKGLRWFAESYLNILALEKGGKGSLKAKLKRYLAFQLIMIFSIIFFRNFYIIFIIAIFSVALFEFIYQIAESTFGSLKKTIGIASGIVIAVIAASSYIYLSFLINYKILIFLLFVLSVSDTFSQVVGESLKGPRLFPLVSPNKTWSGFIGGFIFSILASISFYHVFNLSSLPFYLILLNAVVIFTCGFIGDASSSVLKRRIGIKDFSQIMGAQGGMLDRLDSMIILGPVAVIMFTLYEAG
ncbi:MAG: phosphatidate cytidylyltransferase [Thermodesulfobacteriota bacterium]|jgi:phosphatidate cytidylyltransferase|nr:MAG: phosphatidate cytidylyltransferase [Thermodesulfobacteriota bacterium]